ncbi:MAG: hypothetical protein AB2A00_20025 [Myxococcota bacterium]
MRNPRTFLPLTAMVATLIASGCVENGGGSADAAVPPAAPVLTPLPDLWVGTGTALTVTAVATDPDGQAISFQWTQVSGSTVNIAGANTATLSLTTPSARGDLVFKVTATDTSNMSASTEVKILVHRSTSNTPLPLQEGRTFTYVVREQTYDWDGQQGYVRPDAPAEVGQAVLTATSKETLLGVDIWTLDFTDTTTATGSCDASADPATQCGGTPNATCDQGTCKPAKNFAHQTRVVQLDGQLYQWVDQNTAPILIVDPERANPPDPEGNPVFFQGHELMSGLTRVNPQAPENPLRFKGVLPITVPGTVPAGSLVDAEGTLVELFDGVKRQTALTAYRTTRAYYVKGKALVFFQWEDSPDAYNASGKVGYRDAVLTAITPAP